MAILQEKNKNNWTSDGRSWYYTYNYLDENGNKKRSKSKLFKTKKECENEHALFLLKEEPNLKVKHFDVVAEEYFRYLSKTRRESTLYSYRKDFKNHIQPYFKETNIYTIDVKFIRNWANKIENTGISIKYLNKIYSILKNIFDYAIKFHDLKLNPVAMFGRFKSEARQRVIKDKLRYITKNDFDKLLEVVDNSMYRIFFIFLFYTGCRRGEANALTWKDVDFDKKEILISKTLSFDKKGGYVINPPKNNKDRIIKMSNFLYNELLNYKQEVMRYTDFLESWFVFGNSLYLPKTNADRYKKKYFQIANLKEITYHEFRHSHVSLLVNEYLKTGQTDTTKFFVMMSERLGHTVDEMQKTYLHLFPTIQNEIIDILDNI